MVLIKLACISFHVMLGGRLLLTPEKIDTMCVVCLPDRHNYSYMTWQPSGGPLAQP